MGVQILQGDVRDMLATLPAESVQCVVTSPPYYGLRDYGTATWQGGDPAHEHRGVRACTAPAGAAKQASNAGSNAVMAGDCSCGARRIDRQIGLEASPAEFIAALVGVFDAVRRVMRPDGVCFVNLGDSYSANNPPGRRDAEREYGRDTVQDGSFDRERARRLGIPAKNLLLIPERFAIAMQDRGWIVRSRIAWCKTSAMPESVRDRPTSAWEVILMFVKQARYYYDADAVRQPAKYGRREWTYAKPHATYDAGTAGVSAPGSTKGGDPESGASLRNFWLLGPEPSREQHFAAFVSEIPRRCILAATSQAGQCPACGAPWVRIADKVLVPTPKSKNGTATVSAKRGANRAAEDHRTTWGEVHGSYAVTTLGWAASCDCPPADPVPQLVLDPFLGSGTTALVADQLGRNAVGIELNPEYAEMARRRIANDCPMFVDVEVAG